MKKVVLGFLFIFLLVGCANKKENKELVLDTLESAYKSSYISKGIGLAVFSTDSVNENNKTWYRVATSEFSSPASIIKYINNVYSQDIASSLSEKVTTKYKSVNGKLYSDGSGGCNLGYDYNKVRSELESKVEVKKVSASKITFTLDKKEYYIKKNNDNWLLEEEIFKCN